MGGIIYRLLSLSQEFQQKEWWLSKTFWINLALIVVSLIQLKYPGFILDEATITEGANQVVAMSGAGVGLVNIILRFITSSGVGVKAVK